MDEVKISRDREYAVIDCADEAIGGVRLRISPEIRPCTQLVCS